MTDFPSLNVPGPTITDLSAPFWEAASEGRLLIQRCGACKRAVFYPRSICPHCWQDRLHWHEASPEGRIKSFTQIWKPGYPGWLPVTPYHVGLVELAEGPTMLSQILCHGREPQVGSAVTLAPTKVGSRLLPFFEIVHHQGVILP